MTFAELNLAAATPEIFLAIAANLAVHVAPTTGADPAFGGQFIVDGFAAFMKVLSLVATAAAILISIGYASRNDMMRFEFPILMLIAALGMSMMISANNLISLYVGLELQSLALYVTAAFRRDTIKSTEAGLK